MREEIRLNNSLFRKNCISLGSILILFVSSFFINQSILKAESSRGNPSIDSFSKAKKILPEIFSGYETEFYCGCRYSGLDVDPSSCGFVSKGKSRRAEKIEWEHIVPAHAFGKSFAVWQNGSNSCQSAKGKSFKGRKCAETDKDFRQMESDLYNLVPAIGELNQARSNFSMSMIDGEKREYGKCDFEVEDRKIEPRPEIRGDVARVYFYMDWAYPGRGVISEKNRKLFEAWDKADPVDAAERERSLRIEKIQGNKNPFVK